jgi:hypothetical protein
MTRALVVHADATIARAELVALAGLGYLVELCPGPDVRTCPVPDGRSCVLADRADVLVYDLASLRHRERADGSELIDELRALYADKPLIVITGDPESGVLEPIPTAEGIVRLDGPPTGERLDELIEEALVDP